LKIKVRDLQSCAPVHPLTTPGYLWTRHNIPVNFKSEPWTVIFRDNYSWPPRACYLMWCCSLVYGWYVTDFRQYASLKSVTFRLHKKVFEFSVLMVV